MKTWTLAKKISAFESIRFFSLSKVSGRKIEHDENEMKDLIQRNTILLEEKKKLREEKKELEQVVQEKEQQED